MIGFVGLGNRGLAMVKALLRAGHEVTVYEVRGCCSERRQRRRQSRVQP